MNWTNDFFEFLKSDYKTFHIKEENKYYDFVKIQHNSDIDLLFVNYNNYHKTTIGDKFEYCGFYDNKKEELYDINYTLRKDIFKLDYNVSPYKSVQDLLDEFNSKVRDIVTDYVNENKEEFYDAVKDYESNIEEIDVYKYVIENRKELKYSCSYNSSEKQNVLSYFDEGEQYIFDIALNFIENNKEYIGKKLIDIDRENEYLNKIYKNPEHAIHKRKEIVDILTDGEYVNVHVFINKNNIDYDFKMEADSLKNNWDWSYISNYYMSAPDRREYEKLFGREDLHYEDIYKIEYRNKAIYEDKNFNFETEENKNNDLEIEL